MKRVFGAAFTMAATVAVGLSWATIGNAACGKVSIAEMNWASASLMANVDKIILENQDYKSEVLMMYQKKGSKISFNTIRDNNTEKIWFSSTILERETIIGKGNGSSKKSAEQNACKYILNEISSS